MKHLKKIVTFLLAVLLLATPVLAVDYSVEFICELPSTVKSVSDFGDDDYNYISPEIGSYNVAAVKFSDAKSYFDYTGYLKIEKGEIIIERGKSEDESTYERFSKNGKYGFRHKQTREVFIEPIYDELSHTSFTRDDDTRITYRIGDKWGIMDTAGKEILPAISTSEPKRIVNDTRGYGSYFDERIRETDFYEFYTKTDGVEYAGIIDETGSIVLEPKYCDYVREIGMLPDGRYIFSVVVSPQSDPAQFGVIDQSGKVLVPFSYERVLMCYDVIGSRFDRYSFTDTYRCNGLFVRLSFGSSYSEYVDLYTLLDSTGKAISDEYTYISRTFAYGMASAGFSPYGTFYGYTGYLLNRSGKVVLKMTNYHLEACSETTAYGENLLTAGDSTVDSEAIIVNTNGKILSKWNYIYSFSNSTLLSAQKGEQEYLVDGKTGKTVLGPFNEIDEYNFGLVTTDRGLYDLNGNVLLPKEKGTADILGITEKMPYFTVWNNGTTSIYKLHTSGTAVPSTSTVYVDGEAVQFDVYAVADSNGNYTNYFKIRDLALALSGTKAQFGVSWDGAVNLIPGKRYTATGVEGATPFSGKQNYGAEYAVTKVSGEQRFLDTIILRDSGGNGYTYYKLRDLGYNLGFDVRWDSARGAIVIDTSRPYSG